MAVPTRKRVAKILPETKRRPFEEIPAVRCGYFFLDLEVTKPRSGGVVLEYRVDKRGEGRSLREYDQPAEQNHDDDYRGKPELLSLPHEAPEVCQEIQH